MGIQGLSPITFIVRDLERMATFWCQGLGAREVYDSHDRSFSLSREKFFLLGGVWIAAMEGEPPARQTYQHVAFAVARPIYRVMKPGYALWACRYGHRDSASQGKANYYIFLRFRQSSVRVACRNA